MSAKLICFIACHGGPADHFATFAQKFEQEGYQVQVYASGPAREKFGNRVIEVFDAEKFSEAGRIAEKCKGAAAVITDVGDRFAIEMQKTLTVLNLAYYDNPEPFVPGGYSEVAAQVMAVAQKTLFANANLAVKENQIGLGYYPIAQADAIARNRTEKQKEMRANFLAKRQIEDTGQKIVVYFGGNNSTYFEKAFPAFLSFLSQEEVPGTLLVFQQHPGAKKLNFDGQALAASGKQIIVSGETSNDIQIIADAALYYQTSMGPLFALAGISMIQVGHESYRDIVEKLRPSVTNAQDFRAALQELKCPIVDRQALYESLGIREDWFSIFKIALSS